MAFSREGLVGFMKSELGVNMAKYTDQTELFSGGIIDSHMLLQLITYIEGQTKLRIPTGDLSLENFDTLERMLAYVQRRLAG
ncbi:MAG TPA: acyl carrier protein [Minicystis sp.]|nr:acyl carrier protein [Minicystis sp.]